jgi:hypothetical protein
VDWKLMRPVMRPGQQTAADPASGTIVAVAGVEARRISLAYVSGKDVAAGIGREVSDIRVGFTL